MLDLAREMKISGARDVVFLHGYGEPTILVLHEKKPTWAGRLALVADTCAVSAITLDLDNKRHAAIWRRDALPHSCYRLCAMPEPLGGALVLSQNFIMHESQESSRARSRSTPWRAGTRAGTTPPRPRTKPRRRRRRWRRHGMSPPRKTLRWRIRPPRGAARGHGERRRFRGDGRRARRGRFRKTRFAHHEARRSDAPDAARGGAQARQARRHAPAAGGGAVLSSGMCLVTRRLLFLGSRVGDSLLVSMHEKDPAATQALPPAGPAAAAAPEAAPKKRKAGEEAPGRRRRRRRRGGDGRRGCEDELEAMLYGEGDGVAALASRPSPAPAMALSGATSRCGRRRFGGRGRAARRRGGGARARPGRARPTRSPCATPCWASRR